MISANKLLPAASANKMLGFFRKVRARGAQVSSRIPIPAGACAPRLPPGQDGRRSHYQRQHFQVEIYQEMSEKYWLIVLLQFEY